MNRTYTLLITLQLLLLTCSVSLCQELNLRSSADRCLTSGAHTAAYIRSSSGRQVLELKTAFSDDGTRRAAWDIPLQHNLSLSSGLNMIVCCRNPEIVSQFSVYIRSDSGWQAANFEIAANEQWARIFIPKTAFTPEDNAVPDWSHCHTIRIAAWKGATGQLQLFFTKIEFTRQNASVAILRGAGNGNAQAARESQRNARNIANALLSQGLCPAVIEEDDMAFTVLRPYKLLIVPHCDSFSPSGRELIIQYLRSGGHAGFFHSMPATIAAVTGTPVGKFKKAADVPGAIGGITLERSVFGACTAVNQASAAFIALENLPPSNKIIAWWHTAAGKKTNWPAIVETKNAFWMTHVYMNQDQANGGQMLLRLVSRHEPNAANAAAKTILDNTTQSIALAPKSNARQKAAGILAKAKGSFSEGNLQGVAPLCNSALDALKETANNNIAFNPNEMRAAWCQGTDGLPGKNWQQTLEVFSANGFNAIFPMTASPYFASFDSRLLPRTSGEGLPECIAAAKATGVGVHAWMNCLGIEDAPDATIRQFGKTGRLQEDSKGRQLPWLCPNNPENRRLLSRLATEIVSKHNPTGVHFDRLRYPGQNACFCKNCREAFFKYLGFRLQHWPDAALGGEYQAKWNEFRVASIDAVLAEMTSAVLTANAKTYISVAVYPDCRQSPASIGQDWAKWCRSRKVSFVCPMNYHGSAPQFSGDIKRQIEFTRAPNMLVPGIGTSTHRLDAEELARQINITREQKTYGFILFSLGLREASVLLPALRQKGVTR